MKLAKKLLFGCVGALGAVTGAQAAVLPVKAKPIEYVKVCSLYGAGFYYIPGTDICVKYGGYVRWQAEWHTTSNGLAFGSSNGSIVGGRFNRETSDHPLHTGRGVISWDTRQQTQYGTLRTYLRFGVEFSDVGPSTSLYADRAFIQIAGLTAGRAPSYFDIFSYTDLFGYIDSKTSGDTYKLGVQLIAYTAMLGNGVSLTLSAESPLDHFQAGVGDGSATVFSTNGVTILDTARLKFSDVVGNLRIDQAWGYAGVSGAIHRVAGAYYQTGNNEINGHPDDKYGWAASAGGLVNLPWGDAIGANFVWTKGAIGYATKAGNWQMYGNGNTVGVGWVTDGIFDTTNTGVNTEIHLTRAWSVNAAYEHVWNRQWRTSVYGGYTKIWYDDEVTSLINQHLPGAAGSLQCGVRVFGAVWPPISMIAGGAGNSCSPDFSFYQVGSRTQFTPVSGLDVGLDVFYTHLDTAYKGVGVYPASGARVAATALDDQGAWSAIFRVQRSVLP
jgi:hypothetical protein